MTGGRGRGKAGNRVDDDDDDDDDDNNDDKARKTSTMEIVSSYPPMTKNFLTIGD